MRDSLVPSQRSARLLTTAATSYLGRLGSALAVLVTIPIVKSALPPDQFGVWMMLSGLLGFFAFADLGIGNGVLNRITAAHAARDQEELRRVMVAGYACTGTIGALVFLAWVCWAELSSNPTAAVGHIALEHQQEVLRALYVFALLLAVNIPASLVQKVQLGRQSGHWVGLTQLAAAVGTLVGVPSVIALGGGLPLLVASSLGMQLAANLTSAWLWHRQSVKREAPLNINKEPRGQLLEWAMVKSLMRTGTLFFALQLAAAFAFQSDAIVIVHQLGQVAYGDFAVVQRIFLAASSMLMAGLSGLWPAIGEALASQDTRWVRQTLIRSYFVVFAFVGVTCIGLVLLMPQILHLWLGAFTPPPLPLLIVLGTWTVMEALGNVSGAFLNAAGILSAQIGLAVAMSTVAFLGKWYLVSALGAWGAVLATVVAYSAISIPTQIHLIRGRLRDA